MVQIGFIGAGKVGTLLGRYFRSKVFEVVGYYSHRMEDSQQSAILTDSRAFSEAVSLVAACEWVFLTVGDDGLSEVWQRIRPHLRVGQVIFHCSGAKSLAVFTNVPAGVETCSLHPLLAIDSGNQSLDAIKQAAFTVELATPNSQILNQLSGLGNPLAVIEGAQKIRYHAACVFFSNLVIGLVENGTTLFEACGLPKDFTATAWQPLFLANARNLVENGPQAALTGPVERNDLSTVTDHLKALPNDQVALYELLSRFLLQIAQQKHPEIDYSDMERILQNEENGYDTAKAETTRK